MIEDKERLATLNDHYKDTISYLKKDLDRRDKITIYLFLILIIYSLVEFQQIDSESILNDLCKKYISVSLNINYSLITTIILTLIFAFTMKYFQMCMIIERQYSYIHKIEFNINEIANQQLITRESYSYLESYPLLSAFIHRIYNFFLPIALITLMSVKWSYIEGDLKNLIYSLKDYAFIFIISTKPVIISLINLLLSSLTILTTILYLLFVHRDINWVNKINNIFKKIFVLLHLYKED